MNDDRFDVLVIGAGPAGTCTALAAIASGARTAIIERATFPRTKVCGCCLSPAGVAALRALGADDALHDAVELREVTVVASGAVARIAGDRGVAIGRDALDDRLLRHAQARGAVAWTGTSATVTAPGVVTATDRTDGSMRTLRARVVVVADGLGGSALGAHGTGPAGAPDAAPGWRIARRSRMGFGAVLPGDAVRCAPGCIVMKVVRGGYIGLVRLPDGRIDVAAAADPMMVRRLGGPAACAEAWLADHVLRVDAIRDAAWRGTPALTRRRARVDGPGLMVVGDASGYVEPFTGEGMGWAMNAGRAAGALAARVAQGSARTDEWPRALHALASRDRVRCRAIALALRSPALTGAALRASALAPSFLDAFARRIGKPTARTA